MSTMVQDASDNEHTKKEEVGGPLSADDLTPSILNPESSLPSLQILHLEPLLTWSIDRTRAAFVKENVWEDDSAANGRPGALNSTLQSQVLSLPV
jgi:hypothetical protein